MISYLLCVAALAASAAGTGYVRDREYLYRYSGHMYGGFPAIKPQYAGFSYYADVIIQPHSDYWIAKLDNVKFDKVNEEVHDLLHHQYNYRSLPEVTEQLSKPFRIYFERGLVKTYQVNREEPEWSVNIKRGLLNLFHLNFDQVNPIRAEHGKVLLRPDPNAHFYKVMEDGVAGECETQYVIHSEPYYLTPYYNNVLNVTKSRNYHHCVRKPYRMYTTFYGTDCQDCENKEIDQLHSNAVYHYDIRGDRHHYIIEHVNTEGEVTYVPYHTEGQHVNIYSNRTLHLVDEREVQEELQVSSNVVTHHSLMYEFPHSHDFTELVDLKQPHYLYDIYDYKAPRDEITKLFQDLIAYYKADTYIPKTTIENVPAKFLELVRAISTLGYNDIDELYRTYADFGNEASDEQKAQRYLFFDVISVVGTNPAFMYGKYLIQTRRVPPIVAKRFIDNLPFVVKEPTEILLDEFYRLCDHAFVKENYDVHTACYYSLSTLVYDTCIAHYHPGHHVTPDKHHGTPEIAAKYFSYLVHHYEQTDDEYERVVYIRAAGNMGVKEVVPYLEPYITNSNHQPAYFRVSAIWALRRVLHTHPEEVVPLLVPLFYNTSEDHEMRLAAFSLLLVAHPERFQIENMARALLREPDHQVASYVFSTFHYFANSTHPCHETVAKHIREARYIWEEFHPTYDDYDFTFSKNYYFSGYEEKFDYGGFTQFAYIASNDSYIPRAAFLRLNDYMGGKSFDSLSMGFHAQGFDRIFDKIFGPQGVFHQKTSVFDILRRRTARDVSTVEKELKEIDQKLHIATRQYEPLYGDVFIKVMDSHVSLFHFNETLFDTFFKEDTLHVPDFFAKWRDVNKYAFKHFALGADKMFVFPTEVGLHVVFDYKMPYYLYYKNNNMKITVNPSVFGEDREFKPPTDAKLHIDGHFILDKEYFGTMGVVLPFEHVTFGAGVHRRSTLSLPLKIDLNVDLKTHKVNFKWIPVVPHEVYHFNYDPFTFIDSYTNHVPAIHEESYHPLYKEDVLEHYEHEHLHDYLGLGLSVKGQYENIWNDRGSWLKFLLEKDYRQKFYYLYSNPQFHSHHLDISLTPANRDITNEVEAEFSYEYRGFEDQVNRPSYANFIDDAAEEYVKPRGEKRFETYIAKGGLVARGQRERKIDAELTYTYSHDHLYHKFNVFYDRTPFTPSESENMKVCISGSIKYPYHDSQKVYNLETSALDHTVTSKVKINFGNNCKDDKKITINGRFERSEEQVRLDAARETPVTYHHYNPYAYFYQKCLEERGIGHMYSHFCREYLFRVTKLHKYTFDIKYENLPPTFVNNTRKFSQLFKHYNFYHVDNDAYDVQNPEGQLLIEANISVPYPIVDLRVNKPHERTHYTHLYMPSFEPLTTYPLFHYNYLEEYISYYQHPYCKIEVDDVHTFDNITYHLPPIDCYKVIAKDCSPQENFVILGTKVSHPKYAKAVKVFLGNFKVEALPVTEESGLIVRVNGKKVPVTETEPYYQYVTEHGEQEEVFHVSYNGLYYSLDSSRYGLSVYYDGKAIFVQVSHFYQGKLCGLCGDFNGDEQHEFRGPEGCDYHNSTSFAYSYVIPEDGCNVPEIHSPCVEEHGVGCTVLRNRHVYVGTRHRQVCFSTVPLPECAPGCQETRTVTKTVGFHCLPAKDDTTRFLQRERNRRVLHEVRRKSEDHYAEVEYPEKCHRPDY